MVIEYMYGIRYIIIIISTKTLVKFQAEVISITDTSGSDYLEFQWSPKHHNKDCLYFVDYYLVEYCRVDGNKCIG